ncbi:ester cyclase [Pseudomonas aeruginosa]|uniref:nuclear transport factor 2 family protein n=1 Tax=Pseudomonas TaxID=286 RepID=UPI0005A1F7F8|nr:MULTISPECIES: nuclear transport factor 2 family protein [Pseudomonas]TRT77809.1 MAG: nuclear transport factor 2 family protein [Microcystis aeruginosa Ma_AC_P_19900807_S299]ASD18461.1 nuclear transport factor 2 family protein [Pseudomonas aeruginosa]MCT0357724.1 ester cyclase [Pseudomonas aeruginosa]MCT0388058.1 ester cyclase [Pseudomonas aeruginosa]MDP9542268.1 nuclear transport factor 2 family protein [Pseudomonas putida]
MNPIIETAMAFFEACESGKGWKACCEYCHEDASFSVQAHSLEQHKTVKEYSNSMPHLLEILPDAHYQLVNVAVDEPRQAIIVYARFCGTHTGIDEPVAATGKPLVSDYAFVMNMKDNKVLAVTKVWNDGHAATQLGWS